MSEKDVTILRLTTKARALEKIMMDLACRNVKLRLAAKAFPFACKRVILRALETLDCYDADGCKTDHNDNGQEFVRLEDLTNAFRRLDFEECLKPFKEGLE